jgi:hypothetical protein
MRQSEKHFTDIFSKWQSLSMIPVVLDLLDKELIYLKSHHLVNAISPENIPAYQALYQFWRSGDKNLNSTQKTMLDKMGGCLNDILNQTIFCKTPKKTLNQDQTANSAYFNNKT